MLSKKPKIKVWSTTYIVEFPFKLKEADLENIDELLEKTFITQTTTRADRIFTPKVVRFEVDSRFCSVKQFEVVLNKIHNHVTIMRKLS